LDNSLINVTTLKTNGFDVTAEYRKRTESLGTFDLFLLGTVVEHYKLQSTFNAPLIDYVGFLTTINAATPISFKASGTLTWEWRRWTVGWVTRFFESYKQSGPPVTTLLTNILSKADQPCPGRYFTIVRELFLRQTIGPKRRIRCHSKRPHSCRHRVAVRNQGCLHTAPAFDSFYLPYFKSPLGDTRLRSYWVSIDKQF